MRSHTPRSYAEPLFATLASSLLYFLRFGYDFGQSDQDEFLPNLLSRLHPGLFEHDWFVQTQAAGFHVRTYFVGLLEGPASVVPVWMAVLLLYTAAWLLLTSAIYALAHAFTRDRMAAALAVIVALVLTPQWTLGGNDLAHRMLVPSMLGWGLGLWGVYALLHARPVRAAALLGLAAWMQPLVGLQLAGLFGLVLLLQSLEQENRETALRRTALFGGFFVVFSAPAVLPLVYRQFAEAVPHPDDVPSLFYILAAFRAPHHYLPDAFSTYSTIRFGALAAAGLLALAVPSVRKTLAHLRPLVGALLMIAVLCGVGYVFTEIRPTLFITKLQLFKLTVMAKVLFVILGTGAISLWLPNRPWQRLRRAMMKPWPALLMLAGWTVVFVGLITGKDFVTERIYPIARQGAPVERLERWVRTQTATDAIFAVPPSFSGFRSQAQRAIVVNFKAYPFRDRYMYEWYRRLTDLAPAPPPERGGAALLPALDAAYEARSAEDLRRLSGRYGFGYVVRRTPLRPRGGFRVVYRNDEWTVYRVPRPGG
ncbi:DUF6798 domain-containing protein [Rhodocaloribacter sp.]